MLAKKVEQKIRDIIPEKFGIIFDGWTDNREHFTAIFATWCDEADKVKTYLLCCGVQDEIPDEEDLDFSAESIGDYIFDELRLVGRTFKNIEFRFTFEH
jgi:hypothetical protein